MRKKKHIPPKYQKSNLSPLKNEILELRLQGRSGAEIFRWLTTEKNVKTAYSTVTKFIKRNIGSYQPPSGTELIRNFLKLGERKRENVFTILSELMGKRVVKTIHHSSPPKMNRKTEKETKKEGDVFDFMKIKPGDSPAQIRLKKFGALDSTDLDHIPEELMKPLKGKDNRKNKK